MTTVPGRPGELSGLLSSTGVGLRTAVLHEPVERLDRLVFDRVSHVLGSARSR
ncbi:hypothetical protein [Planomonospora venezuelensis]|uniref:Uncharacterized protein n=1 Tax=Planomonospora venezuelensis TaxID=1999 RepID=A0A841DHT0_PLAVE|nr:hypothetical protein [Planomonospora venezuelensis]MBB5966726.1 hypothetical protein [Planomonospora venezuelensis]